ncbi:hypothetical protein EVG20_g8059 [Dentipellis fragilis]|uniref:Uncharacterized protein n=1 Tax=Dentipellis fragilis TaxID=205917 RepID=A0A4Y9Y8J4_9AGAM|nr:hypothetical protein EVG20_g8059 [Dentipellis fragilis]
MLTGPAARSPPWPFSTSDSALMSTGTMHSISSSDLLFDPPAFDTSIEQWEDQLDYVNEKVEQWKVYGDPKDGLYPDLRAFLMKAIKEHMVLEKQVFSSVEDAYRYIRHKVPEERRRKINVLLDSMNSGHTVRQRHLDDWERYAQEKSAPGQGQPGERDDLGAMYGVVERMASEITRLKVMEKNLRRMKDELQVYVQDAKARGVLHERADVEDKGD